jgi:WD40 repeat protein
MTEPGRFCEECGSPLEPESKFCAECGHPASEAPASETPPPIQRDDTKLKRTSTPPRRKRRFFLIKPLVFVPLLLVLAVLALIKWSSYDPEASWVEALALSPDGRRIAAAEASEVRVWDVSDPSRPKILAGPQAGLVSLAFHPEGRILAGLDGLGRAVVWDIDAGKILADMSITTAGTPRGIAFSGDGNVLLGLVGVLPPDGAPANSAPGIRVDDRTLEGVNALLSGKSFWLSPSFLYPGGRIEVWNVRSNNAIAGIAIEDDDPSASIASLALNPEGSVLAFGTTDGRIGLWDLWGGRAMRTIAVPQGPRGGGRVRCLAFNDDGDAIVATTGTRLLGWSLDGDRLVREIDLRGGGYSRMAVSLAIDPAPSIAVLGFSDGRVELWDLEAGKRRSVFHFLEGFKRTLDTVTRIVRR